MQERKKIGVVGLRHLGRVISAVWARLGKTAVGFNYDALRVENLKNEWNFLSSTSWGLKMSCLRTFFDTENLLRRVQ